jgi:hypothetical protein
LSDTLKARCTAAVSLLERHLAAIPSRLGVMRLVQFDHDSPGLRKMKRAIAEGLVILIESNGMYIHNGLDDAVSALRHVGYTVIPPSPAIPPMGHTDTITDRSVVISL